ncbi:MAG: hypothetical protein ACRC6V_19590 [Bacteroidales bacterium]
MEDLEHIGVEKVDYIVDLYKELRERFKNGEIYDPHSENRYLATEFLGQDPDSSGFGDVVEGCDLFLGHVHALHTIKEQESFADWDAAVGNLHSFLHTQEDEWLSSTLVLINKWIESIDTKVEIPY